MAFAASVVALLLIPFPSPAGTGTGILDAKAKLIHLRGKRYQVRVVSTVPTGGYSKRAAKARRFHCADDCQPSIRVSAPMTSPSPDAIVTQALGRIRHRKSFRLPRFWKVVVAITVDGKVDRQIRLTRKDAR